jgi:hypothetical protein
MEAITLSGICLTENLLRIGEKSGSDSEKWKSLGGWRGTLDWLVHAWSTHVIGKLTLAGRMLQI